MVDLHWEGGPRRRLWGVRAIGRWTLWASCRNGEASPNSEHFTHDPKSRTRGLCTARCHVKLKWDRYLRLGNSYFNVFSHLEQSDNHVDGGGARALHRWVSIEYGQVSVEIICIISYQPMQIDAGTCARGPRCSGRGLPTIALVLFLLSQP